MRGADDSRTPDAARLLGDADGLRLLTALVSIAPTNLEDPIHERWEKPHYVRAAEQIARAAREFGLATRIYDPLTAGDRSLDLHNIPRPNVIVDLDRGAAETILILAHYDVVPVPAEQLARWKSSPHTLTFRADGRLYGRGANDDLGSGVVSSLMAMRTLAEDSKLSRNVRLLACCDEETGGSGGVEALRSHDEKLPIDSPERFIRGDVALIPDGSPRATAGSSGVVFLDAGFDTPVPLSAALDYGEFLVGLHETARAWRSIYASPDWPDYQAPDPVLTGRATLTRFDLGAQPEATEGPRLVRVHAETEASNQIPEAVTITLDDPGPIRTSLAAHLSEIVRTPFRISPVTSTALDIAPAVEAVQLVGRSAHGGYPHLAHNPVPETLRVLRESIDRRWLNGAQPISATFSIDLRLIPEMSLKDAVTEILSRVHAWSSTHSPHAFLTAPPSRQRGGYALAIDDPSILKLERLLKTHFTGAEIKGEYGGTDASALQEIRTPQGRPLPALVFGSMDRSANIHGAEESADPRSIRHVAETIREFILTP